MVLPNEMMIRVARLDDEVEITLGGELDFGNVESLRNVLNEVMGSPKILVDLEQVVFIDSTALGVIAQGKRAVDEAGGQLHLSGAHPRVRRVIELAGLKEYFELGDDE
ncbi:MAG TPA: STAS domain-containing protein [Acidimicrobiia bacterium]|nr:STAS domain-containing protein [Acidimicrobiia bacterium]